MWYMRVPFRYYKADAIHTYIHTYMCTPKYNKSLHVTTYFIFAVIGRSCLFFISNIFALCAGHTLYCVLAYTVFLLAQQQQMVDVYLNGCLLWFAHANTLCTSLPIDGAIQMNFFKLERKTTK